MGAPSSTSPQQWLLREAKCLRVLLDKFHHSLNQVEKDEGSHYDTLRYWDPILKVDYRKAKRRIETKAAREKLASAPHLHHSRTELQAIHRVVETEMLPLVTASPTPSQNVQTLKPLVDRVWHRLNKLCELLANEGAEGAAAIANHYQQQSHQEQDHSLDENLNRVNKRLGIVVGILKKLALVWPWGK